MATHERAGQPARTEDLVDVSHLVTAYFDLEPDPDDVSQQVAFGTSGHRGTSLTTSFNEVHIAATTQAICDYRKEQGYDGPLFVGRDTHALSEPAWATALEVLVANDVTVMVDDRGGYTPTPAVSHAIIRANRGRTTGPGLADGIVVTPSHNPPGDGGFKYNPPNGGPADSDATEWIAQRANEFLENGMSGVRRVSLERARSAETTRSPGRSPARAAGLPATTSATRSPRARPSRAATSTGSGAGEPTTPRYPRRTRPSRRRASRMSRVVVVMGTARPSPTPATASYGS